MKLFKDDEFDIGVTFAIIWVIITIILVILYLSTLNALILIKRDYQELHQYVSSIKSL